MKKLITEMTNEELMAQLSDPVNKSEDLPNINSFPNDIVEFISIYNLKSGEERVPSKLLYKLYKSYSKDPITSSSFTGILSDLFPSLSYGNGKVFCLDKKSINLKAKIYEKLKPTNKIKSKNYKKHFDSFLNFYKIKKGKTSVEFRDLFNLYDKWTYKNGNRNPLGKIQLKNFCKLYFQYVIIKEKHWFKINQKIESNNEEITSSNK